MQKSVRGTDKGSIMITALILVMALSFIFMTLIPRILSLKRFAYEYKARVISDIEKSNREILYTYDLY